MQPISRLEQEARLNGVVSAGQRLARLIRPGKVRDALHGVWLGHPVHPVLVQVAAGAWLSASILDFTGGAEKASRQLVGAGLAAAVPAALAGAADWSEQHEQQMRVGVVHAVGQHRGQRHLRCLAADPQCAGRPGAAAGRVGGDVRERAAWRAHLLPAGGGANHAEEVPHLVEPGWHDLMAAADAPEGKPVRRLLGEVPVVAVRTGGAVRVLADRCSHMSGPLSDGELTDGCLTCPWHGSVFRVADGAVVRGPATAPQPAFEVCEADGMIQVCLPGAG